MIQFEWFDNPLIKAVAVFLFCAFLASALYIILGNSKSGKEQQDILAQKHSNVLNELEKKVTLRKKNINGGVSLKTQIKIQNTSDFYDEQYLEREKQSTAILQKAIFSLRNGREVEGAKYLIAACKIWKNDEKLGKLLMALPILEDILIHLSREDFVLVELDSEHKFSDIDKVINFVLSSQISSTDRKMISEIKKIIHIKRLDYL
ncbi:hypothetical protein [Flavobacterium sp. DG2-3]|uniref:hypothetical protein n=1 Tax=Flavobacterium sp. DG2-3 TaxID=3068317 RepID=UPI00273F9872|nr:hypothetical protein [Flavobacterium sp. DG2-3]MDP5202300.1 hypothetical protein [Flavobacterium sp. DG2-3]